MAAVLDVRDGMGKEIVMKGARRLSQNVQAAASSVSLERLVVVSTAGGVVHDHVFVKTLQTTLRKATPQVSIKPSFHEPVVGVTLMIVAISRTA